MREFTRNFICTHTKARAFAVILNNNQRNRVGVGRCRCLCDSKYVPLEPVGEICQAIKWNIRSTHSQTYRKQFYLAQTQSSVTIIIWRDKARPYFVSFECMGVQWSVFLNTWQDVAAGRAKYRRLSAHICRRQCLKLKRGDLAAASYFVVALIYQRIWLCRQHKAQTPPHHLSYKRTKANRIHSVASSVSPRYPLWFMQK